MLKRSIVLTVAVAVAALAMANAVGVARAGTIEPVERGWKGKTTQGLPVYFGVRNGRVVNIRYHFRWGFCGTFGNHDKFANLEIDPANHWIDSDPRGTSIEGTFVSPSRLEGLVIAEERELPSCPRIEARFTAWPRRR